jgi:hypothetical protein
VRNDAEVAVSLDRDCGYAGLEFGRGRFQSVCASPSWRETDWRGHPAVMDDVGSLWRDPSWPSPGSTDALGHAHRDVGESGIGSLD